MENNLSKEFRELITLLEMSSKINKNVIDLYIKSEALNLTLLEYIENPIIKEEAKKQMMEFSKQMDKMIAELKSVNTNSDIDKSKLN
jgi:hypothetical protein